MWRRPNDELKSSPKCKTRAGHVMVWGCMASLGVGNHFLEGTMDKYHVYCNILKSNLKTSATKLGIKNNFAFYQDSDSKHSYYLIREWYLYNCPETIKPLAQSPDINVIGKKSIKRHEISNKEDLKKARREKWEISPNYTKKISRICRIA